MFCRKCGKKMIEEAKIIDKSYDQSSGKRRIKWQRVEVCSKYRTGFVVFILTGGLNSNKHDKIVYSEIRWSYIQNELYGGRVLQILISIEKEKRRCDEVY